MPVAAPAVPVIELGRDGFAALARREPARMADLWQRARASYSLPGLVLGDLLSRHWARRRGLAHLDEIEAVAALLGRPGAHLLNLSYEWGCSTAVAPAGTLHRVLDWKLPGLGLNLVAAWADAPAGRWLNLTWPGFVGCVQGVAPGRFAIALNQAPDIAWPVAKLRLLAGAGEPPLLLLRRVFETCADAGAAVELLTGTPLAKPAIFCLAAPGGAVMIERSRDRAVRHDGAQCATNLWQSALPGAPASYLPAERLAALRAAMAAGAAGLSWLAPPIVNPGTRLALEVDLARRRLIVQGWEESGPVTAVTEITWEDP